MTPSEKITELKALLAEAKEALMNRDPHTREKECYDSGHVPCQCTLCKINEALKENEVKFSVDENTELNEKNYDSWLASPKTATAAANNRMDIEMKIFTAKEMPIILDSNSKAFHILNQITQQRGAAINGFLNGHVKDAKAYLDFFEECNKTIIKYLGL